MRPPGRARPHRGENETNSRRGRTGRAHLESGSRHSSADSSRKRARFHRIRTAVPPFAMKAGVLLFNLGGPETLRDVKPFLYRLFSDPEIIHVKFSPLRKAIAYTIAT